MGWNKLRKVLLVESCTTDLVEVSRIQLARRLLYNLLMMCTSLCGEIMEVVVVYLMKSRGILAVETFKYWHLKKIPGRPSGSPAASHDMTHHAVVFGKKGILPKLILSSGFGIIDDFMCITCFSLAMFTSYRGQDKYSYAAGGQRSSTAGQRTAGSKDNAMPRKRKGMCASVGFKFRIVWRE